jgi:hypothetical protein
MKWGREVGNGNPRLSQQPTSVPRQLPVVAGDPESSSELPLALRVAVEQRRAGEGEAEQEGRKKNCTACVGLLTMRPSEWCCNTGARQYPALCSCAPVICPVLIAVAQAFLWTSFCDHQIPRWTLSLPYGWEEPHRWCNSQISCKWQIHSLLAGQCPNRGCRRCGTVDADGFLICVML